MYVERRHIVDLEPLTSLETQEEVSTKPRIHHRSFATIRRELSDDELSSPAVVKILIDENERLEIETMELSSFREKYHETDKAAAILRVKLKTNLAQEVISMTCMALSGAALSYAITLLTKSPPDTTTGMLVFVSGGILMLVGIAAKVVKEKS